MKPIIAFLFLLAIHSSAAAELKPFKSDGCSSFSDGTLADKDLWKACCYHHDLAYWQGGNKSMRKQADIELKQCVAAVGKPMIAKLMLAGVRVGGSPYWPTKFRWAYGWPYLRGYKELSPEDRTLTEKELKRISQTRIKRIKE
ncbi:hypothetical protein MNBD_GAMMA02-829 [hydrothermal vent metagenome]|uniref:Uncharacterized protein n=1 Tax=hydrothermal vent metagenome TaxID=652676 RepID=A0A3B0VZA3_9ZZZZ